ncbi:hypothetical protein [Mesorhizobium sp. NFR06]|nr:hypothetical protein [Mesorhizobium sp. NFR06]
MAANIFAGVWGACVLAAVWYLSTRSSPPVAESKEQRELREWLDSQC